MSATLVPGYRHLPGHHCGSTALRNLLHFHGVEISEEMALGLGAGACFYYVPLEGQSPSRFVNGRTARLEELFVELTGLALELDTFEGPEESWAAARSAVDAGRPALLLTDLFYLDHYGSSAHFPGHAVLLAGYDEQVALLSDTGFEELQPTRREQLAKARHSRHPAYPLDGQVLTVPEGEALSDPSAAAPRAIASAARRMLEPPLGEFEGLPALRRFAGELGEWPGELEDWRWCARFAYQVIERRGTGGGNFRLMYSRFLAECAEAGLAAVGPQAEIAAQAAARWSELAAALHAASEPERPEGALWERVSEGSERVLEVEEHLWSSLGAVVCG